ncbi:NAD(P)/FAD-dependent oxidoreductase [Streptomyces roseicoloratus]|uniref:NAD(P)/FAD-dependent oxidoreductase n=1 Tax=Streptomyces roseicoloratus TaxID=2508722 RepID=UPI0015E1B926|nr:FAD-dependent oxidoreductase [Streptomyces roseicoloratus]
MSEIIAVIGGGYGGAAVAKALDAETGAEVVLIEPKDAFEHAAGSLRALVRPEWAPNVFFPCDRLLERGRVVRERAASVDAHGVTLASGARVDADHVVIATGSAYPRPAKSGLDSAAEALAALRATHEEPASARRVLVTGAGPVGLELAGEITSVWPEKQVILVDPAPELLPAFAPELRADLLSQLAALGVELRLGTTLAEEPPAEPGRAKTFTVTTTDGAGLTADIWFRAHGVHVRSDFLSGELAAARTPQGRVRVDEHLRVEGQERVYAVGDVTDLAEAKMAGYAMQHAEVVARNIASALRGERPTAVYRPSPVPSVLLPLGPTGGVGQVPSPEGPQILPAETVALYKGADLFIGRFAELFGTAPDAAPAPDASPATAGAGAGA